MTQTLTIDRPPVAGAKLANVERRGKRNVSASALAMHLDCSRTYLHKLEAEGVIQRQGDGYPLDASRIAYLRFLRRERRSTARSDADADFQKAKTELIRMRIAEKQRESIPLAEAIEITDRIMGILLTHLSGMAARCAGHDLSMRRKIDQVVYQVRTEISEAAEALAGGEPLEPDAA